MQALPKVKQMRTKPKAKIDLEQVERLASTGASIEDICKVLGISDRTLYRHKKERSELSAAFEKGRAKARTSYATALGEIAMKKENGKYVYETKHRLKAIMFFLDHQPGWQKNGTPEADGSTTGIPTIKVKVELPRPPMDAEALTQEGASGTA